MSASNHMTVDSLPPEILGMVFSYLPAEWHWISACVCRNFYSVLVLQADRRKQGRGRHRWWTPHWVAGSSPALAAFSVSRGLKMKWVVYGALEAGAESVYTRFACAASLNQKAYVYACRGGHIAAWSFLSSRRIRLDPRSSYFAAKYGHTNVLEFIKRRGRLDIEKATLGAVEGDRDDVFAWLNDGMGGVWHSCSAYVGAGGRLRCAKWLHAHGLLDVRRALIHAAGAGHIRLCEFLVDVAGASAADAIGAAVGRGRVGVVRWCVARGAPLQPGLMVEAALNGSEETGLVLLGLGYVPSTAETVLCCKYWSVNLLQHVLDTGIEVTDSMVAAVAAVNPNLAALLRARLEQQSAS